MKYIEYDFLKTVALSLKLNLLMNIIKSTETINDIVLNSEMISLLIPNSNKIIVPTVPQYAKKNLDKNPKQMNFRKLGF